MRKTTASPIVINVAVTSSTIIGADNGTIYNSYLFISIFPSNQAIVETHPTHILYTTKSGRVYFIAD